MKFSARVSLEELVADEPAVVPEVPVDDVVDGSESVEAASGLADATAVEIDSAVDTADEAEGDAAELTEMAEVLETSEETGGADPLAVQVAEVSIERFRQKYGIKQTVLPSLESFSNAKTRKSSTKVAVENLKEIAQNIWAKIVALYKKLAGWVGDFIKYVFDANHRIGEEFKKIGAVKLEGSAKNATIPAGDLGKNLHVSGVVTGAGVAKTLTDSSDAADYILDMTADIINQVADTDITASLTQGLDNIKYNFKAMNATGNFKKAGKEYGNVTEGAEAYVSTQLAGGKVVLISGTAGDKKGAEAVAAAKSFSIKVLPFGGKEAKGFTDETIPTASDSEIKEIAKRGAALMVVLSNKKAAANGITKAIATFSSEIDKAAKEAKSDSAVVRPIQGLAQAFGNNMVTVMKAAFGYNMTVAKSALHYAQKSAKQYGSAAAPAAKDAKTTA